MDVLELALDEICRDVERRFSEDLLSLWREIQQHEAAAEVAKQPPPVDSIALLSHRSAS